jgi:hypothetical protein
MMIGRRPLIVGTAALVAASSLGGRASAVAKAVSRPRGRPLALRGVNYDTDHDSWRADRARYDVRAIRRGLHSTAILILGSDLDRLATTATLAAREGLEVCIEARQFDQGPRQTLAFLTAVARAAEQLRREHPAVGISVGCELTLFMQGLVPGRDWRERAGNLGYPGSNEHLNRFLGQARERARQVFGGWLTYSSGVWEDIDWQGFDALGIDLYRDSTNEATYAEDVRALHRHGKPVIITEFGCCTYRGADQLGGDGFDIVDWTVDPPLVKPGYVRDERVQADYLGELLDVYEAEGVHGAFVYDFVDRDSPYSPDPRHDLDMAGFTLVKALPSGEWQPKLAFNTVARRFAPTR